MGERDPPHRGPVPFRPGPGSDPGTGPCARGRDRLRAAARAGATRARREGRKVYRVHDSCASPATSAQRRSSASTSTSTRSTTARAARRAGACSRTGGSRACFGSALPRLSIEPGRALEALDADRAAGAGRSGGLGRRLRAHLLATARCLRRVPALVANELLENERSAATSSRRGLAGEPGFPRRRASRARPTTPRRGSGRWPSRSSKRAFGSRLATYSPWLRGASTSSSPCQRRDLGLDVLGLEAPRLGEGEVVVGPAAHALADRLDERLLVISRNSSRE